MRQAWRRASALRLVGGDGAAAKMAPFDGPRRRAGPCELSAPFSGLCPLRALAEAPGRLGTHREGRGLAHPRAPGESTQAAVSSGKWR